MTDSSKPDSPKSGLAGLIYACRDKVLGFIAKRAPAADIEDIYQEAVSNLIAADQICRVEAVSAWLFRAVKNELIDRSRKVREILTADYENDLDLSEIYEVMDQTPNNPEDEYLKSLFWAEFNQAIADLPEKQREAFIKTEFEGLSFKELAEETGENLNTLLARKHKARLFLRDRLIDLYDLIVHY
ncbi:MAG: sigma-70 family RNA polymerase sigma factor [Deltaproteobacteria bacterium]|nr:sigma-70 family RNA polymerase sigma factor [Deltaproteobacteria bacterium]